MNERDESMRQLVIKRIIYIMEGRCYPSSDEPGFVPRIEMSRYGRVIRYIHDLVHGQNRLESAKNRTISTVLAEFIKNELNETTLDKLSDEQLIEVLESTCRRFAIQM